MRVVHCEIRISRFEKFQASLVTSYSAVQCQCLFRMKRLARMALMMPGQEGHRGQHGREVEIHVYFAESCETELCAKKEEKLTCQKRRISKSANAAPQITPAALYFSSSKSTMRRSRSSRRCAVAACSSG